MVLHFHALVTIETEGEKVAGSVQFDHVVNAAGCKNLGPPGLWEFEIGWCVFGQGARDLFLYTLLVVVLGAVNLDDEVFAVADGKMPLVELETELLLVRLDTLTAAGAGTTGTLFVFTAAVEGHGV